MNGWKWNAVGLALLVTVVVGCSRGPKLYPVKCEIVLNGKPVAKAAVLLYQEKGGRPPSGQTDATGTVQLQSPPGEYTVIITACEYVTPPSGVEVSADTPVRWIIPEKFSRPNESPLTVKVAAGGDNQFKFEFPRK
jgi:hypothetical protein